jgi:hypothetical protein
MRARSEQNPALLFTRGWQRVQRGEGGELLDVDSFDGVDQYAPAGGKLDDESIRRLCDGQYVIIQPGRLPQGRR